MIIKIYPLHTLDQATHYCRVDRYYLSADIYN